MLQRVRNSRGRPRNTPPGFIIPCRAIVAKQPPPRPGWAHELLNTFAAPPVLRMHYGLRLRSMLRVSAYALHAHTSEGDGEASCHGQLLDQLALRTLYAGSPRLVRMAFQ